MRLFRWLMALAICACGIPLLVTLAAAGIASAFNCTLHEGFVNPCVVAGRDIGSTLYTMGMMAWLMLLTIPYAFMLAGFWGIVEIVRVVRARRSSVGA